MFGTILISICTCMHGYLFWRVAGTPWVQRHLPGMALILTAVALWVVFVLGRVVGHGGTGWVAAGLELAGMTWMGTLFLTVVPLLAVDLITLFGFLLPPGAASRLRGWALIAGVALSAVALFQGMRPPVVVTHDVTVDGLPAGLDGTVIAAISDTHLGSLIGRRWLAARVDQVRSLKPDLVVLLGDIFEGHGIDESGLIDTFAEIAPPLGVWAVLGNHEFYGGNRAVRVYREAGFRVLRNEWVEVLPGLTIAGVDDLTVAGRRGTGKALVARALAGRPEGAAILLSHTPWHPETAARNGAGLMLCGHTHGGQIWPFSYLVRRRYPWFAGRYAVGDMQMIVTRGAGTWGPRMRLWHPGEILRVTLRAGKPVGPETSAP